ncbi:phosphotriesterase family protein [Streptomyces sp. NPDC055189]
MENGRDAGAVMTVDGPIRAADVGVTLIHEHVFIDLARVTRDKTQHLFEESLAVAELAHFAAAGGRTVVDVTNRNLGRRPEALVAVARSTGLNIVMGCGWYREPYFDDEVWRRPTSALAQDIITEIDEGVGEDRVRPGIIGEIGSHRDYISPVEEKSFRAAARAQLHSGLTVTTHASQGRVGLAQLDLLEEEGVDPGRVVIGHCDQYPDTEYHDTLARRGAWVEFDLIHHRNDWELKKSVGIVCEFLDRGHLKRTLLSHDVCKRAHLKAYGGTGYDFLLTEFTERLMAEGVTKDEIDTIFRASLQCRSPEYPRGVRDRRSGRRNCTAWWPGPRGSASGLSRRG